MAKEAIKTNTSGKISGKVTATLRYLRIAPRKVRLVAHMIKGKFVNEAQAQLMMHARRSADPILKLLNSAIENAKQKKLNLESLVVSSITVDKGPMLKRFMPRAQGRATPIHKVTSHINIVLVEKDGQKVNKYITEIKKEKKSDHKHDHSHVDKHETPTKKVKKIDTTKEKDLEIKSEVKKEAQTQDKGFMKKVFRRKSV